MGIKTAKFDLIQDLSKAQVKQLSELLIKFNTVYAVYHIKQINKRYTLYVVTTNDDVK